MWTQPRRVPSAGSWRTIFAVGGLAAIVAACASAPGGGATSIVHPSRSATSWADSVLATLNSRDRAAQLVWPQVLGDYTPDSSAAWERVSHLVATDHVGGFVMSVGSPLETAAKINAMQRLSPVPLLFGSDYEAGAGFRTRGGHLLPNGIYLGGATIFPPQMALGATRDSALAYEQGRVTAVEGRAVGVLLTFAPVLDVNNNPNNPVIGPRSFGEDPELVATLATALIRGLQENGMGATGKHFPGHGDTDQNSHLGIVVVNASRPRLDSVELLPFRRAIAAGVSGIMTFHGVVPALDTSPLPATLSPVVMRRLLRQEMVFGGLLITDALDMNGVLARVRPSGQQATMLSGIYGSIDSPGLPEVVKLAIEAGNDVLLMPLDVPSAIDAVVDGVREGRFTQARVDSSVRRVLLQKHALGLQRRQFVSIDSARRVVGIPAHLEVADRIAERSITLAKDSLRLVPLPASAARPRVISLTISARADLGAGVTFDAELRRAADVRSEWIDAADPGASMARISTIADSADYVVVGSYLAPGTRVADPNAPAPLVDLVRAITQRNPRTIVVAFGNPYFYQQVSFTPAYLIAWGGFPVSQRAAARALLGSAEISGRLPISIPPSLRRGEGERRDLRVAR